MENCLFCNIINGKIAASRVYEDSHCLAFLDIAPANKGHTLIIPRQHAENMDRNSPESLQCLIVVAQKIGRAMMSALGCTGYNVLVNTGKDAGQAVFHTHMHVIPRFSHDEVKIDWDHAKHHAAYGPGEITLVQEKLRKFL